MVKKKKKGIIGKLEKLSKQKIKSKKILKTEKPKLTMKQKESPSILSEPNRFFKNEMEEAKKAMFLK